MSTAGYLTHYISDNGSTLTVQIHKAFDFSVLLDFRGVCLGKAYAKYVIDLSQANYIDSSALGMLMVLRHEVGESGRAIHIVNCTEGVREILRIAHFEQHFNIPDINGQ